MPSTRGPAPRQHVASLEGGAPPDVCPTPERIGRYRIAAVLASGGMGTVYLGVATGAGRFRKVVAVKRMHPHLALHGAYVRMFLDEARISARCSHPNLCTVFDVGWEDHVPFLVMEHVDGETLGVLITKMGLHPERRGARHPIHVAALFVEACEGLHAAHELRDDGGEPMGLVHRDISPQNILVGYDGSVRILDFGVAKAARRLYETTSASVKGKLGYMPPEQILLEPMDRRSDIWSLGVTLWEALACKRLFGKGSAGHTLRAVLQAPIKSPDSIPAAAEPVVSITLRALRRDPAGRYGTAREMGRELAEFIAGQGAHPGKLHIAEWMSTLFVEEQVLRRERRAAIAARQIPAQKGRLGQAPLDGAHAEGVPVDGASVDDALADAALGGPLADGASEDDALADSTSSNSASDNTDRVSFEAVAPAPTEVDELTQRTPPREPKLLPDQPADESLDPMVPPPIGELSDHTRVELPVAYSMVAGTLMGLLSVTCLLGSTVVYVGHGDRAPSIVAAGPAIPAKADSAGGQSPSQTHQDASSDPDPTTPLPVVAEAPVPAAPPQEPPPASSPTSWPRLTAAAAAGQANVRREPRRPSPAEPSARRQPSVAAPSVRSQGTIDIATPGGWAHVRIDGRDAGISPTRVVVEAGPHRVELRRGDGRVLYAQELRVDPDQRLRVVVPAR